MKLDPNMARDLAHSQMTDHLTAKIRSLGAPPARFVVGEASDVARAWVNGLGSQNATLFYVLATSGWITQGELASKASTTKSAVRSFLQRLKKTRMPIIREGGEALDLMPFKQGVECWFRPGGKNDKGDVVSGGIKLTLRTAGLKFDESCDTESTSRAQKIVIAENYDGAVSMMERGTHRERSVRDRARSEFERARESRVAGPQLTLVPTKKTGTDGE